jgi:two-component system, NarL family, sensor histidine kinase DevS
MCPIDGRPVDNRPPSGESTEPGFVHAARLELDELLEQLISRARDVQATQSRLRGLLRANLEVALAVDLDEVLRHILDAARSLVDASFAALGVVENGRLVRFLHVGMDDATVASIGHLPEGKGLLGRLIDYPEPLRLPDIAEHLSSVGFPDRHPPMRSFLGVPIRVGTRVFGNLYLTDKNGAADFSRDDEELVLALASAAGVAIANAASFAEAQRRQDWQAAMVAMTTALTNEEPEQGLARIAQHANAACGAAGTAICVPTEEPDHLRVAAAEGSFAASLGGLVPFADSVAGEALADRQPIVVTDPATDPRTADHLTEPAGLLVAVPMVSDLAVTGALLVCRHPGEGPFDRVELEMLTAFGIQAALVLQLAEARQDNDRLRLVEERQHIGEDLQRRVIQRLFRLGLELQGVAGRTSDSRARETITAKVDEIDAVIREIRAAVFSLRPTDA